jgi:superfamily II DNA or RNA helicase
MRSAESLTCLNDSLHQGARLLRSVDQNRRILTGIAIAAGLYLFAEIVKQGPPAAARRLAIGKQGIQPMMLASLMVIVVSILADELPPHPHVVEPEQHHGLGGFPVAPGAPDFLVIRFDAARQVQVKHVSDIRLVDPHAKGNRRHHDDAVFRHEGFLVFLPHFRRKSCVIGKRPEILAAEKIGDLLRQPARQAVDDAGCAAPRLEKIEKLATPVGFRGDAQPQVGPIEPLNNDTAIPMKQFGDNIATGRSVRGRRKSGERDFGEAVLQPRQRFVFGPEARSPFGNAVGLVDNDHFQRKPIQRSQHTLRHQPFRRHIQNFRLAALRPTPVGDIFGARPVRMDTGSSDPVALQAGDLIVHQRHQGRHDDGQTVPNNCRKLIAERLSGPGRHHAERVPAREQEVDDVLLSGSKSGKTEDRIKNMQACLHYFTTRPYFHARERCYNGVFPPTIDRSRPYERYRNLMRLRSWQQKIIDRFPSIIKEYRRFILKAPTGAGKTILASEIVDRFYKGKKIIVLCHRLVLLEQLERALSAKHKVHKLAVSDDGEAFDGYDILLSTSMRAREVLTDAIPKADLIVVDEAHRVSPNGRGYKRILDDFAENGKKDAQFIGLTASPERRTGDQRDQLNLAFDAIIDCADIESLIEEGVLVKPVYRPHFVHDLDLSGIDISSGDFPVAKLAPAIVKSSMIDYAMWSYNEEREKLDAAPISAWFCADINVAEATLKRIRQHDIEGAIVTAGTPIKRRMELLAAHERGEIEAMVSVGVLAEGWDNPHCNIIVHLRPTLSKVLWGQSVGRGLRSAPGKDKCVIIDVSSNWSTFGPVEKLQWSLWSHRRSYMQFMNRFNWIGQQQDDENSDDIYLLCENELPNRTRCSHIYRKDQYENDTCPVCGSYAAIDIYKEQKLDSSLSENKLHSLFFERVPRVYEDMNLSVWGSLGGSAWRNATDKEKIFLAFCMAFAEVSGDPTHSESDYWDVALDAEAKIRAWLVENDIQMVKQGDFDMGLIADGMLAGREIRTVQSHFGISLCGEAFQTHQPGELERKYQKAVRIAERLAVIGCSSRDNLPYFNAADHMAENRAAG